MRERCSSFLFSATELLSHIRHDVSHCCLRERFATLFLFLYQVEGAAASGLTSEECATSGQSRPYMGGVPWVIPGHMEAEYYDYGGQGVSRRWRRL